MAKEKATAPTEQISTFVEVIKPDFLTLEPRGKAMVLAVVEGFLDSLNRREADAQTKTDEAINRIDLKNLIDKNGVAVITTKAHADLAGEICNDLAGTAKEIGQSWKKETQFFDRFHKTLTARDKKCQTALHKMIFILKDGARIWLLTEKERIRKVEAEANRKLQEEQERERKKAEKGKQPAPYTPPPAPVTLPGPKIAGLSGKTKWKHRVPDFMALVKTVARGKAPLKAIQENEAWLKGDTTLNHDSAIKDDKTGKMYLHDGTVEVYEDMDMERR